MPKIKVRYLSFNKILTIKEYWNLIGREPFLPIIWKPDFSKESSFCRMLTNHKNFRFAQIPDKTNYVIFLKRTDGSCFIGPLRLGSGIQKCTPNRFFRENYVTTFMPSSIDNGVSRGILNESFQLIPCQKTFRKFINE